MLYLPDSNILIYAKMSGMKEHKASLAWLKAALADPDATLLVCETVLLSFLRICTNSRVFAPALPASEAVVFITGFVRRSDVQIFRPPPQHFIDVAKFIKKHKFGGDLTMDAHLAAIALSTGATLVTRDKDFKKIPYLKTLDPLI
jgi:toxin-antitoxin system PIN domain toxin